jgi:UDP-GlcNAc:undecaprenyl-phosphate GlcNAc-1-phosphate transferase
MYSLLFLASVSFLFSLFLTPQVRNLFRKLNIVDDPDFGRKIHQESIPRVGGIAIAISYVLALALLGLSPFNAGEWARENAWMAARLLPAVTVVFAVGLLDDLFQLRPWQKLAGQVVASLLAYSAGVHLDHVAGFTVPAYLAIPVTVFWLLACSNAFNLIDGVDGLAAGVGLFATLTTLVAALLGENRPLMFLTIPLAGALLGFLRYNFNPASIFLGDCGSLFVGFLLGCYGVLWAQKSATILGVTAPLMAMAIPLLDTSLAIARRFLRQQPIFTADRAHIHHQLLNRGMKPRGVALILYAVGGMFATLSLLMTQVQDRYSGVVLVLFCAVTWVGIQHLGYLEFGTASRMFVGGAFRRLLNAQLALNEYEKELKDAQTEEQCWDVLSRHSRHFGFSSTILHLADRRYSENSGTHDETSCWTIHIAMPNGDQAVLSRLHGADKNPTMVSHFADVTQKLLAQKSFAATGDSAIAVSA